MSITVLNDLTFEREGSSFKEVYPVKGLCMCSPDEKFAYIPITRCGSILLLEYFSSQYNWKLKNFYSLLDTTKFFTVLRNPFERWVSGFWVGNDESFYPKDAGRDPLMHQGFYNLYDNSHRKKISEDFSLQDPHTSLQISMLEGVDKDNITYFNFDSVNFQKEILHYIGNIMQSEPKPFLKEWQKPTKRKNMYFTVKRDRKFYESLLKYLQPDVDFISTCKFYDQQ